jgi:hypothetical protein
MDEDQKQIVRSAPTKWSGLIATLLSLFGCALLLIFGPTITPTARVIILAGLILLAVIGAVLGFITALKPKQRVAGIFTLLLSLSLAALWTSVLVSSTANPPANNSAE